MQNTHEESKLSDYLEDLEYLEDSDNLKDLEDLEREL